MLTPYMDVGIGHFVQTCNVGALRSDDAQIACDYRTSDYGRDYYI
jgi:hypothetical protein